MDKTVKRPILRYHGGKWKLAKWITSHFPDHKVYVEPYGGAGSVLLRKPRSYAEIYNDLDEEIVNLFKVVRDNGAKLKQALMFTPFARNEFELSYEPTDNDFERARRTVIRSFMGFGSSSVTKIVTGKSSTTFRTKGENTSIYKPSTGFRSNSNRSGTIPAHDFKNFPDALETIIERLRGVVIENRDGCTVMNQHDSVNTLHYIDPPYVLGTRWQREKTKSYNYEMTDEEHINLCKVIRNLNGYVIISGYDNEIYNDLLNDWYQTYRKTYADGAKERVEKLWINKGKQSSLFN